MLYNIIIKTINITDGNRLPHNTYNGTCFTIIGINLITNKAYGIHFIEFKLSVKLYKQRQKSQGKSPINHNIHMREV